MMRGSIFSLFVASALAANFAQATSHTIEFKGEVKAQTCKVRIEGQRSAVIDLGEVSASVFTQQGYTTNKTRFTMEFTECGVSSQSRTLLVTLEPDNVTQTGGYLANDKNAAKGIALQVLRVDSEVETPLDFSGGNALVGYVLDPDEETGLQEFAVQYISTENRVTAGKVRSTVKYSVSYL